MKTTPTRLPEQFHVYRPAVRRRIAAGLLALSMDKRTKPADRRWLAMAAEAWLATLPAEK
jgi:hypothetical protein